MPASVASVDVTFNPADPQVEVAVAVPVLAGKLESSHSIAVLVGWKVQAIALASITVTSKLQLAALPHSSVAVKVRFTVPTFWVEPIAGNWVMVIFPAEEQLSVTVAEPV